MTSASDCLDSGHCLWSGSSCSAMCSTLDQTTCASTGSCQVYSGVCVQACQGLDATSCAAQSLCYFDPSTQKCGEGCSSRHSTDDACRSDSQCVWTGFSCEERCELRYTSGTCPSSDPACELLNGECITSCARLYVGQSQCQDDENCRWVAGECDQACSKYTSISECPSTCRVYDGQCSAVCSQSYFDEESCNSDPLCQFNTATFICDTRTCIGTGTQCPAGCAKTASSCGPSCSNFTSATCTNLFGDRCEMQEGVCINKCSALTDPSFCSAQSYCLLVGSTCQPACQGLTATQCSAASLGCIWRSEGCTTRCSVSATTEAACSQDSNCFWQNGQCTDLVCAYSSETDCVSDSQCEWDGSTCHASGCGAADQATCIEGGCKWTVSTNGGSCGPSTCRHLDSSTCSLNPTCYTSNGTCFDVPCQSPTAATCTLDPSCSWNAATNTCTPSSADCLTTPWSDWSTCSAPCAGGTQTRTRKVIRQPLPGGAACPALSDRRTCNDDVMCTCSQYPLSTCIHVLSCVWTDGACSTHENNGCGSFVDSIECLAYGCLWSDDMEACFPSDLDMASQRLSVDVRSFEQATFDLLGCNAGTYQVDANGTSIPYPYTSGIPGWITVFPDINVNPSLGEVDAVQISIESGYSVSTDFLGFNGTKFNTTTQVLNRGGTIITAFAKSLQGVWVLRGPADITAFAEVLSLIQFGTTSKSPSKRVITWSIGADTLYSTTTGHLYYYNVSAGSTITWAAARASCEASYAYGAPGYLVQVNSRYENNVLARSMAKSGWIGATDEEVSSQWGWARSTLRTPFWSGANAQYGGKNVSNGYAAWEPVGLTSSTGEPNNLPGDAFAMIKLTGYWADRPNHDATVNAFFCEYGDASNTIPGWAFGTSTVQLTGCLPTSLDVFCSHYSGNRQLCQERAECRYTPDNQCLEGCGYISDNDECRSRSYCRLDLDNVPVMCVQNPCSPYTDQNSCTNNALTGANCVWNGQSCTFPTTCARFTDASRCLAPECSWDGAKCVTLSQCDGYKTDGACNDLLCQAQCQSDAGCLLVSDGVSATCTQRKCVSTSTTCDVTACNDRTTSTSTNTFTPGQGPAAIFKASYQFQCQFGFVVSIVSGMQSGDQLFFDAASNPSFTATYDSSVGLLVVLGYGSPTEFESALRSVTFNTNSDSDSSRTVTWSMLGGVGQTRGPVFVPDQNYFVEFVWSPHITYNAALFQCSQRVIGGLQGQLLRINSQSSQKSTIGTVGGPIIGWIAGSGTLDATGPVWTWTNRTAGSDVFFRGDGLIGSISTYANWAPNEPTTMLAGTTRRILMSEGGKWQSANDGYGNADGYYCYYPYPSSQAIAPEVAGTVVMTPRGCTAKLCVYTDQTTCLLDPRCEYKNGQCQVSVCASYTSVEDCKTIPGCYFDGTSEACKTNPADVCVGRSASNCNDGSGACTVTNGACVMQPCTQYPDAASCDNDPSCMMADGQCVRTLCGSTTKELCLADSNCLWGTAGCAPNVCLESTTASECAQYTDCEFVASASPPCAPRVCSAPDELLCVADPRCVYDKTKSQCTRSACTLQTLGTCTATAGCAWDSTGQRCVRSQCNFPDQLTCTSATAKDALTGAVVNTCQWSFTGGVAGCAPLDIDEISKSLAAAADSSNSGECTPKEKDLTALAAVLGFLAFLLAIVLAAMWRRQVYMAKAIKFQLYGEAEGEEVSQIADEYRPVPLAREELPAKDANHRESL